MSTTMDEIPTPHKDETERRNLTATQLACGYVEIRQLAPDFRISLYKEHSVYHVRAYDFSTGHRVAWESFDTLSGARKVFRALVREYSARS